MAVVAEFFDMALIVIVDVIGVLFVPRMSSGAFHAGGLELSPSTSLLIVLDLAGTFVFAIEGAMTGMENALDLLGVLVLAFSTALGGGIIRDILLGATPPPALWDWRYPTVAFAGGAFALAGSGFAHDVSPSVIVDLDAAGLALFSIAGAQKALDYGMPTLIVACLGAITGVGGGTVRDVLLTHIPAVLRVDIYATAALGGVAVMILARKLNAPPATAACVGGLFCFALRLVSLWQGWSLPKSFIYR